MGKKDKKKDAKKQKKNGKKSDQAAAALLAPDDATVDAFEFPVHPKGTLKLADVDLDVAVEDKDEAEKRVAKLQKKIYALQTQTYLQRRSAVFVFEGWDAAGKGGAIKRLTALLDPRGYKVWPISAPKESEAAHNYLWRFAVRMPERGEIAIFDRSWYGRVLVERVEGFADRHAWSRAYDEINAFERTLTAEGVLVAKFWLHIDQDTQLQRFKDREKDAIKSWKIGPEDWRNRKKWHQYEVAAQDMFDRTHRPDAPWHLIPANDKKYARIAVLEQCAKLLEDALE